MEGEVNNFIMVWMTVLASLFCCHTIAKFIPQGTTRLLAILPIICLFLFLPLNLTTMYFAGLTSFFITWLANFKLLLFAFGQGPLSSNPPLPLSRFILISCLPIKTMDNPSEKPSKFEVNGNNPSQKIPKKGRKSPLNYAIKTFIFCVLLKVYHYIEYIHPKLRIALFCFHMYFMLEKLLAMVATLARALVGVELEPQFDEPYLSTSIQDFWGKRWNLMVTSILHPTIYDPTRSFFARLMPRRWASLPAVFATFLVSGVMHELIFYYIGRLKPTGEVTCFFLIQGVCVGIEIGLKRALSGKFRLHPIVSGAMALGFMFETSFWLFFPPFLRFNPDVRGCKETIAFLEFVMHGRLVSPNEVSCPLF